MKKLFAMLLLGFMLSVVCSAMSTPPETLNYHAGEAINIIKLKSSVTIEAAVWGIYTLKLNENDYGLIINSIPYIFVQGGGTFATDIGIQRIYDSQIAAVNNNDSKISSDKYIIIKTLNNISDEANLRKECFQVIYHDMCKAYPNKYRLANMPTVYKGTINIGLTEDEVIVSWGEPRDKNKTVGSWGVSDQWIYPDHYLYFENGKLTSWQEEKI